MAVLPMPLRHLKAIAEFSLPESPGHQLDSKKKENEEKRAPTETHHNAGSSPFIHFRLFILTNWDY
jgi:hypothetical protein